MTTTTTIPIDGIMTFLNTMTLSPQSKRWLGENLIEQAAREEGLKESEAEHTYILKGLDTAFKEGKQAQEGKLKGRPLTELLNEI